MTAIKQNCHVKIDPRFEGRSVVFKNGITRYHPFTVSDFIGFILFVSAGEPFTLIIEGEELTVAFDSNGWCVTAFCPDIYDGEHSIYIASGKDRAEALYNLIEQISEYRLSKS